MVQTNEICHAVLEMVIILISQKIAKVFSKRHEAVYTNVPFFRT